MEIVTILRLSQSREVKGALFSFHKMINSSNFIFLIYQWQKSMDDSQNHFTFPPGHTDTHISQPPLQLEQTQ